MSRYVERAENVARFIDVNLTLMLDSANGMNQQWLPLVSITGDDENFKKLYPEGATQQNVLQFLTFNRDNPNSIISCLRAARENARSVREIISSEMWLHLNTFYLTVNSAASAQKSNESPNEFFTEVKLQSHLFNGITDATMTHGEAWNFHQLGVKLERADKTSRILDVKYFILLPNLSDVGKPIDEVQWVAVLRSASAFEMYRKRHGRIAPKRIVDFLLLDAEFPRAIRFCLNAAQSALHCISGTPIGTHRKPVEKLLGQMCSDFAYTNVDEVINNGLHEYLDDLQTKMNMAGAGIHEQFFARRALESPRAVKERI